MNVGALKTSRKTNMLVKLRFTIVKVIQKNVETTSKFGFNKFNLKMLFFFRPITFSFDVTEEYNNKNKRQQHVHDDDYSANLIGPALGLGGTPGP